LSLAGRHAESPERWEKEKGHRTGGKTVVLQGYLVTPFAVRALCEIYNILMSRTAGALPDGPPPAIGPNDWIEGMKHNEWLAQLVGEWLNHEK